MSWNIYKVKIINHNTNEVNEQNIEGENYQRAVFYFNNSHLSFSVINK